MKAGLGIGTCIQLGVDVTGKTNYALATIQREKNCPDYNMQDQ
jgi:hypothetical protein